jgi:glycosyltransferase involved in cell wall biosynthesis
VSARSKFRILHCLRAPVGGLFRHVCDLAAAQSSAGHEVAVICAASGDALTEDKLAALAARISLGVHRIESARAVGLGDISATRHVMRLARELKTDVLHGHGAKGGAYARLAAHHLKTPLAIYTPHGGSLHYAPTSVSGRVVSAIERRLETMTDGLIFESRFAADRYAAQIGVPRVPARVIPNGVLEREFDPVVWDADATDLLFVGELRDLKGVDVLLRAMALLGEHRRTSATIVGAGPDADAFKALATELNLMDRVRFTGAKPARDAFKMGRVMIMPSRAESFPYIALEAGAAGLPLVATRVGGLPEIAGDTGLPLLPAGDAEALAAFLIETQVDDQPLTKSATALQQRIRERFTVTAMADGVMSFYRDVAALQAASNTDTRLALAAE